MSEFLVIFLADKLYIFLVALAVIYFLFTTIANKLRLMLFGALSIPLAYAIGKIAGLVVITTRPFVELGVNPLVYHVADNGFPSEHTLYSLVIAGVVFTVHKKLGILLIALGLLVGVGRIFALIHNPVDILGSIVIAAMVVYPLTVEPVIKYIRRAEVYLHNISNKLSSYNRSR